MEPQKNRKPVTEYLSELDPVFTRAAVGDFSVSIDIPDDAPKEIVALYTGINVMLDVINRQRADLRERAREADELNRLKSEFVTMVSHQLRTPLSLMKWSVERLSPEELAQLSDRARADIETIRIEIARMSALVSDTLDVSRLEAGVLAINPREIDIVEAARAAVMEVTTTAHQKRVTLVEDYPDGGITIPADPTLMHVIYGNLLSNAVKYTSFGDTVTLRIAREGNNVAISVADTGLGIPEDERDRVFGKLFRGAQAQKADATGTGLGLYIVRAVVEACGGSIRFESREGEGTTFFITLPAGGMKKHAGNIHLHAPPPLDIPVREV